MPAATGYNGVMAKFLKKKRRKWPPKDIRYKIPLDITSLRHAGNTRRELGITPRQEEFARLVATSMLTYTEAARRAGYTKQPDQAGFRLMSSKYSPKVVARVVQIKEELSERYDVTFENHVQKMAEIRDAALDKGNFTAAVAAEKSRGQVAGLYISRQEIMVGKIDQMSREEVMDEIRRIQTEFPTLLGQDTATSMIDVTPQEDGNYAEVLNLEDRNEDVGSHEERDI